MKQRFFLASVFAVLLAPQAANAETCGANTDALGTSRTIFLDTSKGLEAGHRFGRALPLADKEVVLTFDDGPLPVNSEKVRRTLKAECVQATFFIVGRNALTYPAFVRKLAADGHSIGTHTWSHDMHMPEQSLAVGMSQINRGIAAVNVALKTSPEEPEAAPFFRFPGLNSDHKLRGILKDRGVGIFDIDVEGGDWIPGRTSKDVFNRVTKQLQEKRRGIILLHDIQPRTAAMLPDFLRYLKKEGYSVVHIAPKPKTDEMTIANAAPADQPFQTAHETPAEPAASLNMDDMVISKSAPKKRLIAKAEIPGEKLQRMATAQIEPKAQIDAPRKTRIAASTTSEPLRRTQPVYAARYADAQPFSPPLQPRREKRKYLLNELFKIGTN